jgi:uncharacterized protein with HEPN domain
MRDRLIHDYVDVDYFIVWDVAETHVPELISQLGPVVKSNDQDS